MDTLKHIADKYGVDITQPIIHLPIGRFKDVPRLFKELGFKVGAEIGVFEGEYSRLLLRQIPDLKLYCVDLWQPYKGYKDFKDEAFATAYEKTKENTKGYNAVLLKGWSNEIISQFADESLDFVFIDGNHAYEYVVEDIALWSKKVRKGGIVYGHDYDDYSQTHRHSEMHVQDAVNGWVNSYRIKPLFIITNNRNKCWLYVK